MVNYISNTPFLLRKMSVQEIKSEKCSLVVRYAKESIDKFTDYHLQKCEHFYSVLSARKADFFRMFFAARRAAKIFP